MPDHFGAFLDDHHDDDDNDDSFCSQTLMPAKTPNKHPRSTTNAASKSATVAKKSRRGMNKENKIAVQAAVEADEILGGRPWSVADRSKLFIWLLGADGDAVFQQHKKDPARVHKKVKYFI